MQGFAFKAVMAIVILSFVTISGQLFAGNTDKQDEARNKIYSASGCMGCHQNETMDEANYHSTEKNRDIEPALKQKA